MVTRARIAQEAIADYGQEQVDELVTAVAWAVARKDRAEALAQLVVDEGGFGNYPDKVIKINKRVLRVLRDIRSVRTVGVVSEDPERGLVMIAKPVGVVAALIPTTGPDATPPVKTLFALKGRNAIIVAPHPRTKRTSAGVVGYMREACEQVGAPADLVQVISAPSISQTQELMRQADLIVATGGTRWCTPRIAPGPPPTASGSATPSTWSTRPPTSMTRRARSPRPRPSTTRRAALRTTRYWPRRASTTRSSIGWWPPVATSARNPSARRFSS